jgi:peroxiredoxin
MGRNEMKQVLTLNTIIFLIILFFGTAHSENILKDFTFRSMDGTTFKAKTLKGKPIVMNIMAHWCVPCRREAQELQKAYLSYKNRGVLFLGVFVKSDENDIRKFAETYHVTFPVGKDNGIARKLAANSVPVTVFITKNGRILKRHFGPLDYTRIVMGIESIIN